jgi:hypothetical protein
VGRETERYQGFVATERKPSTGLKQIASPAQRDHHIGLGGEKTPDRDGNIMVESTNIGRITVN